MTIEQIIKKEFGEKRWKKLNPRFKKLFRSTDALVEKQKPVSRRLLEKALS